MSALDHVVIHVDDWDACTEFYVGVLGVAVVDNPEGAGNPLRSVAYRVGSTQINVHGPWPGQQSPCCPEPFNAVGSADLAFRVREDPAETIDRLRRLGVDVVAGPVRRFGAGGWGHSVYCHDPSGNGVEVISYDFDRAPRREPKHPELQPADERTALIQRLEQYRETVSMTLKGRTWAEASSPLLPATDLTIAGIVRHLAWAEDRWFQGRLLGVDMPAPWNQSGADDGDHAFRLQTDNTVEEVLALYGAACDRSRSAVAASPNLDRTAVVPSFGKGPVNLRWILVHMIDETARHAGHLDLLCDTLA